MKDCKVNVLGTTYKIRFRHESEDEKLQELYGYCDYSSKTIVSYMKVVQMGSPATQIVGQITKR